MFSKAYCINFHTNCEINIESIELKAKKQIPTLPNPTREGYHFRGWFKDESLKEEFNLEKMPKEDITLYAKWEAITLDEFLQDINYFTKSANILKSLQNDYEDVPDFKDTTKEKETKPKTKKKTTKKTTKKKTTKPKTTKSKTTKVAKADAEEIKEEATGEE